MRTFWHGLASIALCSLLFACPGGGSSSSPTLTGKISNYGLTSAGVLKVYAVTNPRVDLSVSPLSYVALTAGATVIADGTVSATGDFSLQLPSDTTMTLYGKPRVLPSQQSGCTVSSTGSETANVAQIVVKVENNGVSLGFLTQQSPGADNINASVPGTYYDIWHYWTNTGFGMSKTCTNVFDGSLNFTAGWNNISARTTVSVNDILIFDALKTGASPGTLEWILKTSTVNGF